MEKCWLVGIRKRFQVRTEGWQLPYIFIIIEEEATQDVNGQNLQRWNVLGEQSQSCSAYCSQY